MGIGRREFLRLTTLALSGLTINPLNAIAINDNAYVNKKLGILFFKPQDWGFIAVKDFGKLKSEQIIGHGLDKKTDEIWNCLVLKKLYRFHNEISEMKKADLKGKAEEKGGEKRILFKVKSDDPTQAALRRWLVMEIYCGRMSVQRAIEEFEFEYKSPTTAINDWKKLYEPTILLTLPQMTEKEREKVAALEKHIKQIEKQLEAAQMKATALDMMIDIAESKLKISIRKKSGTKQ